MRGLAMQLDDAVVLNPERDGRTDIRGTVAANSLRTITRMLDGDLHNSEQFMAGLATFEPGTRVSSHLHADAEEICVVMEGKGNLITDKGSYPIKVGEWQFIPKGVAHSHENTGDVPLTILWVYSPPTRSIPR